MSERLIVEAEEQARKAFETYCSDAESWLVTDFRRDKSGDYINRSTTICWHFWEAAWKELASHTAQESRGEEYRKALWAIANTEQWLVQEAENAEQNVSGDYVVALSKDVGFLRSIARKALDSPVPQTVNVEEESSHED